MLLYDWDPRYDSQDLRIFTFNPSISKWTRKTDMTSSNRVDDCTDIAKTFCAIENLEAQSSLWFRPLRQLLERGKPTGTMTVLAFHGTHTSAYPFGVFTHTKNNRIVFWPVLPKNADMVAAEGKVGVIDHITLELSNEKTHVTAYDAAGEPSRCGATDFGHPEAWRLQRFEGSGLAIWFTFLVKWSTLLDQETVVERWVKSPHTAEAERLKRAFARHAGQIKIIDVPLPKSVIVPQYVYCVVYLITEPDREIQLTSDIFLHGHVASEVDGWHDGENVFEIQPMKLHHEQANFLIATACPSGIMRQEVALGFPGCKRTKNGAVTKNGDGSLKSD